MFKKTQNIIPITLHDLALRLKLISYPCLEHIFSIPKVLEPLKFYCVRHLKRVSKKKRFRPSCAFPQYIHSLRSVLSLFRFSLCWDCPAKTKDHAAQFDYGPRSCTVIRFIEKRARITIILRWDPLLSPGTMTILRGLIPAFAGRIEMKQEEHCRLESVRPDRKTWV